MDYFIQMALAVILETVKQPKKRQELKRAFAKLVRAVIVAYGSDREFLKLAGLYEDEAA